MKFQPGWKMTILALGLFPVVISLGIWQLSRAEEKRVLIEERFARMGALPIAEETFEPGGPKPFTRVRLDGRFDPEQVFFMDNQIMDGTTGYAVLHVFASQSGQRYLVNRGWIAAPGLRDELPHVDVPSARTIIVLVWPFTGLQPIFEADPWSPGWPKRIQRLELDRMASAAGLALVVELRLEAGQPGVLRPLPDATTLNPGKNTGYASSGSVSAWSCWVAGWRLDSHRGEEMTVDEDKVRRSNRMMLIGIVAIAAIPMLGAYLLYRAAATGDPWATTNQGTLLDPVVRFEELGLINAEDGAATSAPNESGTWWLLTVTDAACDPACHQVLEKNRALHVLLAKDTSRLRRGVVFTSSASAEDVAELKADFPKLFLLASGAALPAGIYLGDPLGNLILRYEFDQAGEPVLKDLKKLLKISQVG